MATFGCSNDKTVNKRPFPCVLQMIQ